LHFAFLIAQFIRRYVLFVFYFALYTCGDFALLQFRASHFITNQKMLTTLLTFLSLRQIADASVL